MQKKECRCKLIKQLKSINIFRKGQDIILGSRLKVKYNVNMTNKVKIYSKTAEINK